MSWQRAAVHVADALAEALDHDQSGVDIDVALCARAAMLDHVSTVLADLAPRTSTRHVSEGAHFVPVALVETDPLDALGRVLHGRTRLALDRAPSELLDVRRSVDEVTGLWVQAGRFALVADQCWWRSRERRAGGERARHVVGELACLAYAVAVLDRGLLAAAPGRSDVRVSVGSTAGLRVAAHEVIALSATGESSAPSPPVRDAAALTEALADRAGRASSPSRHLRRLTGLLVCADELTPHQIRACAVVARDLTVLAAADAIDPAGAELRVELGALAQALHAAARADAGEFAICPRDQPALTLQLGELRVMTAAAFAARAAAGTGEATRIARRLPTLVDVLRAKANAQVELSRWAVPHRAEDAQLPYAFASHTDPLCRPPMLEAFETASAVAREVEARSASPMAATRLRAAMGIRPPAVRRPLHLGRAAHARGQVGQRGLEI